MGFSVMNVGEMFWSLNISSFVRIDFGIDSYHELSLQPPSQKIPGKNRNVSYEWNMTFGFISEEDRDFCQKTCKLNWD